MSDDDLLELQFMLFKHLVFVHRQSGDVAGPFSKQADAQTKCPHCELTVMQLTH
jgi:hypothetical protein